MILEYTEIPTSISNEELIADMLRVSRHINKEFLTAAEYDAHGKYHSRTISKRFETWNNALTLAGLKISNRFYSDEDLFNNLANIWMQLGRQPSKRDLAIVGSPISYKAYVRHFGKWSTALKSFVAYFNDLQKNNPTSTDNRTKTFVTESRASGRDINLRLRFLVMSRDKFKCCICGASPANDPSVELQIDHILPWSKGGKSELSNLQTLCKKCNLGKSDLIIPEL